jgi:hypothetical protein
MSHWQQYYTLSIYLGVIAAIFLQIVIVLINDKGNQALFSLFVLAYNIFTLYALWSGGFFTVIGW